jgi:hypothetical protein
VKIRFNGYAFAARPSGDQAGTSTYFYSPVIPAGGTHVSGRAIDARKIQARFPWLLLFSYNSNGYRGVVADEDRVRFATSDRSLIPDEVILPMFDDGGNRISYSLEPQFPADTIDPLQNIPWDWTTGELSVRISGPDGSVVDLGTARFQGKSGNGPTTKTSALTSWRPQAYGRYTVTATGWIADRNDRRYRGGGTYRFWIAKRMTLATATFQGMPYPVGSNYGRDILFNPAVPGDVQVTATLYVNSDATSVRTLFYSGKASTAGLFGAAQGMKPFPLNAPGEYHAQVLATYADPEGHLWVSTMRHAGVVYSDTSLVVARGKKFAVGGKYVEHGETKFEGYSPHLYPEYITDVEYYYAAAPRPGFMGRFLVGESTVRAPYWPVSPNSFGGQIGASPNGDAPGDIYRLLGSVVLRRAGQAPMYAGYLASAFLLSKGTNNNRVVAPGSEDLHGPTGEKARFFLLGLRPGTAFEVGSSFRPAVQIDPLLPASIDFVLTYPDGRQQTASGVGDKFGSFAGPSAWPLDVPGVYRYQLRATWNGRVVHLNFFSEEKGAGGASFFDFARVILRGTTLLSARATIPAAAMTAPAVVPAVNPAVNATDLPALRAWDTTLDRLLRAGDLIRVSRDDDTLLPGRTHERLRQFYQGVPVFGADVTRQLERGVTVSIFGVLRFDIDLDPMPAIDADDARAVVERRTG